MQIGMRHARGLVKRFLRDVEAGALLDVEQLMRLDTLLRGDDPLCPQQYFAARAHRVGAPIT